MASSNEPDVVANVVAVLIGCVAAFVSIGKKMLDKRRSFSKLWLGTEVGSSIIAGYIGYEIHPVLVQVVPAASWMPKTVFVVLCIYSGSRLVLAMEKKATDSISN